MISAHRNPSVNEPINNLSKVEFDVDIAKLPKERPLSVSDIKIEVPNIIGTEDKGKVSATVNLKTHEHGGDWVTTVPLVFELNKWNSSESNIIKIEDDGTLTPLREGKSKIKINLGNGFSAEKEVTVRIGSVSIDEMYPALKPLKDSKIDDLDYLQEFNDEVRDSFKEKIRAAKSKEEIRNVYREAEITNEKTGEMLKPLKEAKKAAIDKLTEYYKEKYGMMFEIFPFDYANEHKKIGEIDSAKSIEEIKEIYNKIANEENKLPKLELPINETENTNTPEVNQPNDNSSTDTREISRENISPDVSEVGNIEIKPGVGEETKPLPDTTLEPEQPAVIPKAEEKPDATEETNLVVVPEEEKKEDSIVKPSISETENPGKETAPTTKPEEITPSKPVVTPPIGNVETGGSDGKDSNTDSGSATSPTEPSQPVIVPKEENQGGSGTPETNPSGEAKIDGESGSSSSEGANSGSESSTTTGTGGAPDGNTSITPSPSVPEDKVDPKEDKDSITKPEVTESGDKVVEPSKPAEPEEPKTPNVTEPKETTEVEKEKDSTIKPEEETPSKPVVEPSTDKTGETEAGVDSKDEKKPEEVDTSKVEDEKKKEEAVTPESEKSKETVEEKTDKKEETGDKEVTDSREGEKNSEVTPKEEKKEDEVVVPSKPEEEKKVVGKEEKLEQPTVDPTQPSEGSTDTTKTPGQPGGDSSSSESPSTSPSTTPGGSTEPGVNPGGSPTTQPSEGSTDTTVTPGQPGGDSSSSESSSTSPSTTPEGSTEPGTAEGSATGTTGGTGPSTGEPSTSPSTTPGGSGASGTNPGVSPTEQPTVDPAVKRAQIEARKIALANDLEKAYNERRAVTVGKLLLQQQFETKTQRLNSLANKSETGVWATLDSNRLKHKDDSISTSGVSTGYDVRLGNVTVGVLGSYGAGKVKGKSIDEKNEDFSTGVYGIYKIGNFYGGALVDYQSTKVKGMKNFKGGNSALQGGYKFKLKNNISISPQIDFGFGTTKAQEIDRTLVSRNAGTTINVEYAPTPVLNFGASFGVHKVRISNTNVNSIEMINEKEVIYEVKGENLGSKTDTHYNATLSVGTQIIPLLNIEGNIGYSKFEKAKLSGVSYGVQVNYKF